MSSIIRSRSGVVLSLTMKSSCLSIEKPQSSNRSARSQNAQAYQIKTNTSHKRHCRASGFVREPKL
jgi:hypothetical protein